MARKPPAPADHLSALDLARSELARARLDVHTLTKELLAFRIDRELREANARIVSLRNDQAANLKELGLAAKAASEIEVELSDRYGVDMSSCAYDSITGKITPLEGRG